MNYGPRFRSSAVGVGAHYDKHLDKSMMVPGAFLNMSAAQIQAASRKSRAASSAKHARMYLGQPEPPADERLAAEERLVERIGRCIDILSFGIAEMMMAGPARAGRRPLVSQHTTLNLIVTMCKVIGREPPDYRALGVRRRAVLDDET
jgi:hypothetical protein